jgi:hypothetical protein
VEALPQKLDGFRQIIYKNDNNILQYNGNNTSHSVVERLERFHNE